MVISLPLFLPLCGLTTEESMSQPNKANARLPLILAGASALLVAALVLAFLHVHSVSEHHSSGDAVGLTKDQQAAVVAAATEAANVTTYSRKTFDADFARALNGSTGALKSDLTGKRALAENTMTSGKYDLKGTIGASAYIGPSDDGKSVLVMVTVNAFKVADTSSGSSATVQRFQLTMVKSGKRWLASDLNAVGIE